MHIESSVDGGDAVEPRVPRIRRAQRWDGLRVLVVEDDPEMRTLLEDAIADDGFDVVGLGDGSGVRLEMLIAANSADTRLPAVLVTDVRMPDCDGIDLIAEVRRRWWWMPAVVVTGYADAALRRRARTLGCCRVLSKPVDLDLVRLAVRESLRG